MYWVVSDTVQIIDSKNWIAGSAIIKSSEVGGYSQHYSPRIIYEYEYRGLKYTNSQVTLPSKSYSTLRNAQFVADKYEKDKKIGKFINPLKSNQSVIVRPTIDWSFIILIGVPVIFILYISIHFAWKLYIKKYITSLGK